MLFQEYLEDQTLPYAGVRASPGRIVPLISSYVTGSLGVRHLPRLWLKGILYGIDALAEGYGFGPGGLDRRVMEQLGIEPAAFMSYLLQSFPTYPACEEWVCGNAGNLAGIPIANDMVGNLPLRGNLGDRFRTYYGINGNVAGIMLNNVDDWWTLHAFVTEYAGTNIEPIVPAVSSMTAGPAGIEHLPRFWVTTLLAARNALHRDASPTEELDALTARNLGFVRAAAKAFIASELPSYLRFEAWIREHATHVDSTSVTQHNAAVRGRRRSGATQPETLENDLRDWQALHESVTERRARLQLPLRTPPREPADYRPSAYSSPLDR
jgi:hypothetical protein